MKLVLQHDSGTPYGVSHYSTVSGLRDFAPNCKKALQVGTLVHELLALYYSIPYEVSQNVVVSKIRWVDAAGNSIRFPREAITEASCLFRAYRAVRKPDEFGKVLAVEKAFWRVVGYKRTLMQHTGRFDLVAKFGRELWIVDHKTEAVAAKPDYKNNLSFVGYCLAAEEIYRKRPEGVIVNRIIKSDPPQFVWEVVPYPSKKQISIFKRFLYTGSEIEKIGKRVRR